ncbi:MAG: ABC transporter ATP-binding protein [Candidatus Tectomicrobia bacterium]|nr:ABC transporter ATP-binding protein [Candidatus Tectomicrobia bacterium]
MALLEISQLTKRYGGLVALDRLSLRVEEGEFVGLIGPNGSGKSTLFNVVNGLVPPTAGSISFDGQVISGRAPHQVRQAGIGRTFQMARVFQDLTCLENVLVPLIALKAASDRRRLPDEARQLLALVRLDGKATHAARSLSYGESRRLDIAKALAASPRLLLLDEPYGGLHKEQRDILTEILTALPRRRVTVILIEHLLSIVVRLCPRLVVLDSGRIIADGSPADIRANDDVIHAYIGAALERHP